MSNDIIDKRVERNTQSVLALWALLQNAIKTPADYLDNTDFENALKSQGALSKFGDESRGVRPLSLNTVKRIAEIAVEGGFDALDRLRANAFDAIAAEKVKGLRPNKVGKIGLVMRVKALEQENQALREDLLLLTLAFEKSLSQGKNYAVKAEGEAIKALCKREQRELLDTLSLRKYPLSTNVAKLHER
jgi:hypothetical protein